MCKVHKDGNPLRPVVAMLNTAEYKLAKYLDNLIKPHIPSRYMLNSTDMFIDKLNAFTFEPGETIVSFDVCSLFTNVPLQETIDIITDQLYSTENADPPPFPKKSFKKLLSCATNGIFMYKDEIYSQTDGVTMGNPLGPTLANFFMAHMENKVLLETGTHMPKLYLRYVDDIFAIFDNDFNDFFNLLNEQHPNIKFTYEGGSGTLPFLDTNIEISAPTFISTVFRKKTHTNLMLNFNAVCPTSWKTGLIKCLLHRAWKICANRERFNFECEILSKAFCMNGYPRNFFNRVKEGFLACVSNPVSRPEKENEIRFICQIPYIGNCSREFAKRIREIVKEHYDLDITCVFTSFKIRNYFSLKCKTPSLMVQNAIYKFTCLRDADVTYIGKTKRHFKTRRDEHFDFKKKNLSPVALHVHECQSCQQGDYLENTIKVIKRCANNFDCEINEALLIQNEKPILNTQLFESGASFKLKVFS